jgi:hypothetical protein
MFTVRPSFSLEHDAAPVMAGTVYPWGMCAKLVRPASCPCEQCTEARRYANGVGIVAQGIAGAARRE